METLVIIGVLSLAVIMIIIGIKYAAYIDRKLAKYMEDPNREDL